MPDLGLFDGDPEATASLDDQRREALKVKWRNERSRMPGRCRAEMCRAPIVWALTEDKGEWMPLDLLPRPEGNVEMVRLGQAWLARVVSLVQIGMSGVHGHDAHRPDIARHVPHWSTCKDPDQFRRRT